MDSAAFAAAEFDFLELEREKACERERLAEKRRLMQESKEKEKERKGGGFRAHISRLRGSCSTVKSAVGARSPSDRFTPPLGGSPESSEEISPALSSAHSSCSGSFLQIPSPQQQQQQQQQQKQQQQQRQPKLPTSSTSGISSGSSTPGSSGHRRVQRGGGGGGGEWPDFDSSLELIASELSYDGDAWDAGEFSLSFNGTWRGARVGVTHYLQVRDPRVFREGTQQLLRVGNHPNVCRMFCSKHDGAMGIVVSEHYPRGRMMEFLRDVRASDLHWLRNAERRKRLKKISRQARARLLPVSYHMMLKVLHGVAFGLRHLHEHGIVHRNVNGNNVLLRGDLTPSVCNFAFSEISQDFDARMSLKERDVRSLRSVRWMAPEAISSSVFNEATDAYSFGVLMWEVFSLEVPFASLESEMSLIDIACDIVTGALQLPTPLNCPPPFEELMLLCRSFTPSSRPNFNDIVARLERMIEREPVDPKLTLDENPFLFLQEEK